MKKLSDKLEETEFCPYHTAQPTAAYVFRKTAKKKKVKFCYLCVINYMPTHSLFREVEKIERKLLEATTKPDEPKVIEKLQADLKATQDLCQTRVSEAKEAASLRPCI